MRNGADALCAALEARGVTHALGLPGTQNVALWEALRRSRIRPVLTTHELGASFMASGYYRASGRIAPVVTIPGPGFTYALTGLAEALQDSAALLQVVAAPLAGGHFRFQALDQAAIAGPLSKAVRTVDDPEQVEAATLGAVDQALEGEPGPVVLQWTERAMEGPAPRRGPPAPGPAARALDAERVERIAWTLSRSHRPLILAGQGCAGASELLRTLAERLGAPVVTSTSGRGVLPEDHPLALGFEFVRGDLGVLNELARAADVILVLGWKLCEAGTSMYRLQLPRDRLIHVDASDAVAGVTYPASEALVARVEDALEHILPLLGKADAGAPGWSQAELTEWGTRLRASTSAPESEPRVRGAGELVHVSALLAALRSALPRDAIVVSDSGFHQTLLRRHLPVLAPRGLIVPSDYQSMGFGLPAAIGAALAAPKRPVVAVIGDGCMAMSGLELLTAVRERLPIVVLVFNDGQLNRIRLQQLSQFGQPVAVELLNPDFEELAHSLGARYERIGADAEGAFARALAASEVTVLELVLGDAPGLLRERAKGLARGAARRAMGEGGLRRVVSRLLGRGRRRRF